jgi:alpha-tubulin suppressor-like RCC1 family protein
MQTGGVKCWGDNIAYTGHNDLFIYTPVDIVGLESGVSAISVGSFDAFVIMSDGGIKCWGANAYGELGIGSLESIVPPPVDVICPNCSSNAPGVTTEPTATPG